MDWYAIFKFLHVVAAVCWVGGGVVLMFQGLVAARANDTSAQMVVVKQTAGLTNNWFIPASMATLIFGAITATLGGNWSEAWVVLGLAGFAATFCTGFFGIRPLAESIAKAESEGRNAGDYGGKMLQIAKFDYVMLFTVIADMVLKPQWSDLVTIGIMAVVLAVGAVLFLLPGLRPAAAT
jgi:uncharacterized membrane protein